MDITDQQKSPSIAVATLEDVQRDLGALRNDVSRLSKEVSGYLSETGRKAFRDANEQAGARTHWGKPPTGPARCWRRPLVASAALIAKKRPRTGASKELESPRLQDGATSRGYHSSF